jgi:hypothetical protein
MNATTLERPDVLAYLKAVRAEFADLPTEEREELVADLEAQLVEAGEPPLLSPHEFAAELREAAGLDAAPRASILEALVAWLASDRIRQVVETARELEPIWWLARAYVATAIVALLAGWGWPVGTGTRSYTLSLETSALVLVLAVVASVWLGLRARRVGLPLRRVRLTLNVALALAAVPVAVHTYDRLGDGGSVLSEPVPGLAYDGVPVRNVYPFSRDGELLLDVLLYDQEGRPLDLAAGDADPYRRYLATPDATPVLNAFPIRYYEPGTDRVANPVLAPAVELPEIETPPLDPRPR